MAVLFLDLDEFKTVNDSLGHTAGDQLLRAVADRLQSVTRSGDTLARLGGDEFALLLRSGAMPQVAQEVAGRVEDAFRLPFNVNGNEVPVRVSIGIAVGHPLSGTSEDLLRDADLAMYLAKQNGKARSEMVRPGMQDEALKRLALITDLHQALAKGELEVFYQPIVRAHDAGARRRRVPGPLAPPPPGPGAPGRLRERGRDHRLYRPARPLGAQGGLPPGPGLAAGRDGGRPVLYQRQPVPPPARRGPPRRGRGPALADFELPARCLVLEVTESTLMLGFDAGLARLQELKDIGLRIALDDYGTGYSSLNRLGRLPIDIVKIDKSFIDRLLVSPEGRALVQSVLDVTHALGKLAIAEGVELAEQRATLQELRVRQHPGVPFRQAHAGPRCRPRPRAPHCGPERQE